MPRPLLFHAAGPIVVFWLAVAAWLAVEALYILPHVSEQGAIRRDRGSRSFVIAAAGSGFALGCVLPSLAPAANIAWHPALIFGLGIVAVGLGVALRLYAIWSLGLYFTTDVAVREGQRVVESGPYRYIRHPSYSGVLLTLLGVGLMLTSWASIAAIVCCALVGLTYRVAIEERALVEALGEPYRAYMRRTRRFVPFVF